MHQAAPELFQRALNPDFQGHAVGCKVPRYFWRLSPAGEARRAEIRGG